MILKLLKVLLFERKTITPEVCLLQKVCFERMLIFTHTRQKLNYQYATSFHNTDH